MPKPIDRCSSCRREVYEELVNGACACAERDFRLLLARQRRQNASLGGAPSFVGQAESLPLIESSLLMSAAGRNELEAAKQVTRLRPTPVAVRGSENDPPGLEGDDVADLYLGSDPDWTGTWNEPRQHTARVASMSGVDLSAMWLQGTGIPYEPNMLTAPEGDGFEFDMDLGSVDVVAGASGRHSAPRYRVDAPPRPVGNERPVRESSRVRGFPIMREESPPSIVDQVRSAAGLPPRAPPQPPPTVMPPTSAIQRARQLQASSRTSGPSAYDLIRRSPLAPK